MNGIEVFEIIKHFSTFQTLLSSFDEPSKRGKIFEIVSNIIIRFGFFPLFTNNIFQHYEGNINTCNLKKVDDLIQYLHKLNCCKSGSSDITLQNKFTNEYIFISCKFCFDDSKNNIKYYEIQDINSVILQNKHKYKKYKIYLFVNDKIKVQQIIDSSEETNKHLKNSITDIIGLNDLELCFQNLKKSIQNISIEKINKLFCNDKISLELRFHQDLITHQLLKQIDKGECNLLIGAKARSGKTYCIGGLFIKYFNKYNRLNALIITPAPNETISQFTDDLFYKFRDFIDINIIEIKKGSDFKTLILKTNNIIIVSKQLLDDYVLEKTIYPIKNLNLDAIVFDENHFHGTTQMSKNILQSYSSSNTFKLYLTATYIKPLNEWNIPIECQFYWDIEDEQMCKKRNIDGLIEKHGEDVSLFINDENKESILNVYDNMPDLHIITNMMDLERYHKIKERIQDTTYGFSNGTLLSITKDGKNFNYIEEVDTILKYISGNNKIDENEDPIRDEKSIFERIKKISNQKNSRTKLNNGDFTSQLWFLPFGKNMYIDNVSVCLKNRMLKNRVLCKYEIMIVNSKKDFKLKNVKQEIKNQEIKAKEKGKNGLIILAGNQLTLGITLPLVDIVFLFNDVLSSDKIVQMMYRSMTETIKNDGINDGTKKIGYVIDMNISRVLNTMLDYNIYKKDLTIKQKIEYLVENHLINIDSDLFENKENKSKLIDRLLNIWKSDPVNNVKILLKKIEDNVINLENKDQKLLNKYFTNSTNDKKNKKIEFDEENNQPLQSGKEIKKKDIDKNNKKIEDQEDQEDEEEIINISLTKDILPFIIPLSCILTIQDNEYDFIEMIDKIKNNNDLLKIFDDQSFIWWNKKDIIKLIKKIVNKYVEKNSNIYSIAIQFKMSLQGLIDKPKELLELIDTCLKPKEKEKKQFGEVFTPPKLIEEMLDKLPLEVWNNPDLKWLDPASGMGNYPIMVYLRLLENLTCIEDLKERKKHILENMLYMVELNKKNVFVCKQIFDINNEYKLNVYNEDFLKFKSNIQFDIIMGNPPYQEANATGDNKLYLNFTKISLSLLKKDGLLLFITPRNILEYLLFLDKNRKYINNFYQINYIAIETSNKYFPNVGSSFTYFLIKKTIYNHSTIIEYMFNDKIEKIELLLEKGFKIPRIVTKNDIDILLKITSKTNNYILNDFIFNNKKQRIRKQHIEKNIVLIKESKTHKIKIIDTINKTNPFPGKYYYYDKIDNDFNKNKLILSKKGYLMPFIDKTKEYTYSDNFKYIIDDNLEKIKLLLESNITKYLLFQYSKNGFDSIDIIKNLDKKNLKNIKNNNDLYKLYDLNEEEIKHINNILNINENKR